MNRKYNSLDRTLLSELPANRSLIQQSYYRTEKHRRRGRHASPAYGGGGEAYVGGEGLRQAATTSKRKLQANKEKAAIPILTTRNYISLTFYMNILCYDKHTHTGTSYVQSKNWKAWSSQCGNIILAIHPPPNTKNVYIHYIRLSLWHLWLCHTIYTETGWSAVSCHRV